MYTTRLYYIFYIILHSEADNEIGTYCSSKTLSFLQFERSSLMYSHNNAAVESQPCPKQICFKSAASLPFMIKIRAVSA